MKRLQRYMGFMVFLLALTIRVSYVLEDADVLGLDVSRLDQTDNYVFAQWARGIADGDWLCREQPHAYHHWTEDVAPEGRWIEWYGGEKTFHQAPLYPYLIAVVYALSGDEHVHVGLFQALLGALACWLTVLIGQRTVNQRAGLFAGLLLAFCGPYFFYDAFILRDGPMAFFVALSTLALVNAVERDRLASWFLAGTSLGLFTLAKETGVPLLLITLGVVTVWRRRAPTRLALTCAVLVVGWFVVASPAFARNVTVGTAPFRLSTRGPEVFVAGNVQGQDGVGWTPPADAMRRILQDSNFSLTRSMAYTLATHRSDPWGYVELLWNKTEAFFNSHEVPNNVDFYLHRSHLSMLKLGFVSLSFLAPAALLGLLLGIPRKRKLAVPYLMFGAVSASVIALYILARFRLQVLPLMAVFAGLTIDWFATAAAARRRIPLICASLVFAALATWTWSDSDPFGEKNKYTGIMLKLAKIGDFEKAEQYRDMLIAVTDMADADADPIMAQRLLQLYAAFEYFDQASTEPEGTAQQHLLLAKGYAELVHVTKRGDLKDFVTLATQH
ncbi:MAG: 4-amino-4-deoxy-L-arabinose transferase-like glycosyltransferase, partial [Pseudohongiellaceae bacterium]